jgi:hypothetical protein
MGRPATGERAGERATRPQLPQPTAAMIMIMMAIPSGRIGWRQRFVCPLEPNRKLLTAADGEPGGGRPACWPLSPLSSSRRLPAVGRRPSWPLVNLFNMPARMPPAGRPRLECGQLASRWRPPSLAGAEQHQRRSAGRLQQRRRRRQQSALADEIYPLCSFRVDALGDELI